MSWDREPGGACEQIDFCAHSGFDVDGVPPYAGTWRSNRMAWASEVKLLGYHIVGS